WVLLSRKSGPRPQFTMSVFATIRLLELFAMFTAGSASIIWARLLMLEEILTGWQAVFTRMPFGYGEHTFHYFDHSEGGTALFLFWQSGLAVRTGPIGYMLALLLNLAWLAIVFLFCRWAVGRSAVREE
ncbi:hypothetical protein KDL29_16370, partial [bacterium]|nr:hypothetical protein [bacterium]